MIFFPLSVIIYIFLRTSYSQNRGKDKGAMMIFTFFFLSLSRCEPEAWRWVHFFLTRMQICTFDLWPPRCWLQAAAASQKPLYACWQPGSKGCKTLVASLHYSQWRRQPAVQLQSTTTRRKKNTRTHTPATSYYLCENKKQFFISQKMKKK